MSEPTKKILEAVEGFEGSKADQANYPRSELDRNFVAAFETFEHFLRGEIGPILERLKALETRAEPVAKRPILSLKEYRELPEAERKATDLSPGEKILMALEMIHELRTELSGAQKKLRGALEELTRAVALLKERGALAYRGVYQRALTYEKGDLVTYSGSAWVALVDSPKAAPGGDFSWQMISKGGK